jgi:hypothetical protein
VTVVALDGLRDLARQWHDPSMRRCGPTSWVHHGCNGIVRSRTSAGPGPDDDVTLNLNVDAIRHEVCGNVSALPIAPDDAKLTAGSRRKLIRVMQVEPDDLAADSESARLRRSQALKLFFGNLGLVGHATTSSPAGRCRSSSSGRANRTGRSRSGNEMCAADPQ